jgi:Uncharacterized conserved protein
MKRTSGCSNLKSYEHQAIYPFHRKRIYVHGHQYRLLVNGDKFFIDLLFYHRGLQCMVAFVLKTGKFKPEYVGKLNFHLNALDQLPLLR